MTLVMVWFIVIAVLWTGFFILEGSTSASPVGVLHGRTWDGLLTGGSLVVRLLIGIALGDLPHGLPARRTALVAAPDVLVSPAGRTRPRARDSCPTWSR
jgi:cytochrome bd-type quinol oxidase subunit 2